MLKIAFINAKNFNGLIIVYKHFGFLSAVLHRTNNTDIKLTVVRFLFVLKAPLRQIFIFTL